MPRVLRVMLTETVVNAGMDVGTRERIVGLLYVKLMIFVTRPSTYMVTGRLFPDQPDAVHLSAVAFSFVGVSQVRPSMVTMRVAPTPKLLPMIVTGPPLEGKLAGTTEASCGARYEYCRLPGLFPPTRPFTVMRIGSALPEPAGTRQLTTSTATSTAPGPAHEMPLIVTLIELELKKFWPVMLMYWSPSVDAGGAERITGQSLHALTPGCPRQQYPVSCWQVELHPSPLTALRSSHVSCPRTTPSPQSGLHTERPLTVLQANPDSILHSLLHPSPLTALPSSHCSADENTLFPQMIATGEAQVPWNPYTPPEVLLAHQLTLAPKMLPGAHCSYEEVHPGLEEVTPVPAKTKVVFEFWLGKVKLP
eukprot:comp4699_c0_seq1/m.3501 comp4699_c0_seq1/g.3501  ORF comp4699_c0_seq1/g.3501 comp4699_c0_seq1/m.3501 type:complete len:364 (+) comp4699_c0_seq1:394-1485(+)